MREILFRGKLPDTGEWVEGYVVKGRCMYILTAENIHYMSVSVMGHASVDVLPVRPETVGQFTGLTDKHGKRIFEGDIVQYHAVDKLSKMYLKRYHVDMDEDRRGWWPFACGDGCGCCEEDTLLPCECEIIGNIHDNPELMEKEN